MPKSRKPIGDSGQTLPELGLVLFGFCSAVFVIVQTVVFCWNQVEIQRMAQVAGNDVAASTMPGTRPYFRFNKLWGNIQPAALTRYSRNDSFHTARSYRGVSTYDMRGLRLGHVDVTALLVPQGGWVSRWLLANQQATVQTLIEPAIAGK